MGSNFARCSQFHDIDKEKPNAVRKRLPTREAESKPFAKIECTHERTKVRLLMKDYKIYEGYLDDVELGTATNLRESMTELPHANEAPALAGHLILENAKEITNFNILGNSEKPRTLRIALNEIDSFQTCTCLFSALAENLDRFVKYSIALRQLSSVSVGEGLSIYSDDLGSRFEEGIADFDENVLTPTSINHRFHTHSNSGREPKGVQFSSDYSDYYHSDDQSVDSSNSPTPISVRNARKRIIGYYREEIRFQPEYQRGQLKMNWPLYQDELSYSDEVSFEGSESPISAFHRFRNRQSLGTLTKRDPTMVGGANLIDAEQPFSSEDSSTTTSSE